MRNSSPIPTRQIPREEPEKIKKWREEQKKMLEEKESYGAIGISRNPTVQHDKNEEIKKEEWRENAKKELEEWYKHHEDLNAKTRAANRSLNVVKYSLTCLTMSGELGDEKPSHFYGK
uniref:Clathrin light chain n=1 Tax=Rhodnius prolixus TaxID=13249 RepID=T1HM76_RHOPR